MCLAALVRNPPPPPPPPKKKKKKKKDVDSNPQAQKNKVVDSNPGPPKTRIQTQTHVPVSQNPTLKKKATSTEIHEQL